MQETTDKPEDQGDILSVHLEPKILKSLGDDVNSKILEGPNIHSSLAVIWNKLLAQGLDKQVQSDLLSKYPKPKNALFIQVPLLNAEVAAVLNSATSKKDLGNIQAQKWERRLSTLQEHICASLAAVRNITNIVLGHTDFPGRADLITLSGDLGQILANAHNLISMSRRAAVSPLLSKAAKEVGFNNNVDEYLLGKDFDDKYKKYKEAEKAGQEFKPNISLANARPNPMSTRNIHNSGENKTLNYRGPSRGRRDLRQVRGQPSFSQQKTQRYFPTKNYRK